MFASFSSFGNSFFLIDSLIRFAKSLQISLFANLTIFVGITRLVFFPESNEVIILEMSPLLTKLKSNRLIDLKTDLILSMLRCFSYFLITLSSGSSKRKFEHSHLSMFNNSIVTEVCVEKICYLLIFRNYLSVLHHHNSVVKICDWISKERFAKFPKVFKR